jgi:uncharacterized membrane protein YgdD (TMEM256/DUF423 family)
MSKFFARIVLALAALLLATATGLGAIASHALEAAAASAFATGVDYQFVHSLGVMALAIYGERHPERKILTLAAVLLLAGIVLFCGGVYASSLDGPRLIAGLAPIGGIGLILGWLVAAFGLFRSPASP